MEPYSRLSWVYYLFPLQANYKIQAARLHYEIYALTQRLRHANMRAEHEEQVGEHTHTSFSHMELDVDSFNLTLDAELSPQIGGNFALSGFLGAADYRFVKSRGEGGRDSSKLYSSQLFFLFFRGGGVKDLTQKWAFLWLEWSEGA